MVKCEQTRSIANNCTTGLIPISELNGINEYQSYKKDKQHDKNVLKRTKIHQSEPKRIVLKIIS